MEREWLVVAAEGEGRGANVVGIIWPAIVEVL